MDTGTLITGTIALAISVLPFIMIRKNRIKRERSMRQTLQEMASARHCTIKEYGFGGNFILGLDKEKRQLFFHLNSLTSSAKQHCDLADIASCEVRKTMRSVQNTGETNTLMTRLELCLIPKSSHATEVRLELYSEEYQDGLQGELEVAEIWARKINELL